MAVSACFAINQADYFCVDGFDEKFKYTAGDYWDFCSRIQDHGMKLSLERDWRVFHKNPNNLRGVAKKPLSMAKTGSERTPLTAILWTLSHREEISQFPLSC